MVSCYITGERLYGNEAIGMQYSFLRAEPSKNQIANRHPNVDALVQTQMKQNANDGADIFGTTAADVRSSVMAGVQQCEEKIPILR